MNTDDKKTIDASYGNVWGYTGDRVKAANEQAARGDVGGALVNGGIVRAGENVIRDPSNTSVITSNDLSSPGKTVSIPNVPPSTTADGIIGVTQSYVDRGKELKDQQQRVAEAQASARSEKDALQGTMKEYLGVQSSRADLEKEAGIQGLTDTADEARITLEQSQRAQINEIKGLENQGLTSVQKNQAVSAINRRYALEQADLQFNADIAERRLDRASKAIDRKIQLQLEPLKTQLDFTKMFYEDNREDLNKEEDRLFQQKIKELDRNYETEKANKTAIGNIFLEFAKNGVIIPQSVVSELNNAKDSVEAASILAKNGITLQNPLDIENKRLQNLKLQVETQKVINESASTTKKDTQTFSLVNDISNVLSSEVFDSTFGFTGMLTRSIPNTAQFTLKSQVQNIIDQLALAARGELKGQGSVSDFEGKMLKSAQTALQFNMSPADARKELAKVKGAIATSSGLKALVKITDPKTGTSSLVEADSAGITNAIKDGLRVEYQ